MDVSIHVLLAERPKNLKIAAQALSGPGFKLIANLENKTEMFQLFMHAIDCVVSDMQRFRGTWLNFPLETSQKTQSGIGDYDSYDRRLKYNHFSHRTVFSETLVKVILCYPVATLSELEDPTP